MSVYTISFVNYSPPNLVGLGRIELPTSPLSGVRSNQLSYRPYSSISRGLSKLNSSNGLEFLTASLSGRNLPLNEASIDLEFRSKEGSDLLRKEVIQPQVPLRLPCYDFTPVTSHTMGGCLLFRLAHRLPVQLASMV